MRDIKLIAVLIGFASVALVNGVSAHCEVPCGIYDDKARVGMIREHARTVEKAMNKIKELKNQEDKNHNQLVRWITNKEEHANKIQDIVYQYFMAQRVKVVSESENEAYKTYVQQVTLLHRVLVRAMKCKQTTDVSHVEKLRDLVDKFEKSYFEKEEKGGEGHQH